MTTPPEPLGSPPDPLADPDDAIVDSENIAAELGVHIQTVQRLFRTGELRGQKIGRRGWVTTRGEFRAWITGAAPAPAHRIDHQTDALPPIETKDHRP